MTENHKKIKTSQLCKWLERAKHKQYLTKIKMRGVKREIIRRRKEIARDRKEKDK